MNVPASKDGLGMGILVQALMSAPLERTIAPQMARAQTRKAATHVHAKLGTLGMERTVLISTSVTMAMIAATMPNV